MRFGPLLLLVFGSLASAAPAPPPCRIEGFAGEVRYAGKGSFSASAQELVLTREVPGHGPQRVALRAVEGEWRGRAAAQRGARGALSGQRVRGGYEVRARREAGGLRVEWRSERGVGRERWRLPMTQPSVQPSRTLRAVQRAVAKVAARGTLPAAQVATKGGNRVDRRLRESGEVFAAMARLIARAEHEVLIQTYVWRPKCQASLLLFEAIRALEARRRRAGARRPVRVRIVTGVARFSRQTSAKGLVKALAALELDPRYVEVQVRFFKYTALGVNHTKAMVVDGRSAVITGANVQGYFDDPNPWFDLGTLVHGPVAGSLRAEFDQLWTKVSGAGLPFRAPAPPRYPGGVPILVVTRPADGNPLSDREDDPAAQAYLSLIAAARTRIRILTPNLNDDALKDALLAALRRGVRVEAVLSHRFNARNESLPLQGGSNTKTQAWFHKRLRAEPAALARLDWRWFSRNGERPVTGNVPGASHAKYLTVDGRIAVLGSSNLDTQAINHSRELNLVIESPALVSGWDRDTFNPVFERATKAP